MVFDSSTKNSEIRTFQRVKCINLSLCKVKTTWHFPFWWPLLYVPQQTSSNLSQPFRYQPLSFHDLICQNSVCSLTSYSKSCLGKELVSFPSSLINLLPSKWFWYIDCLPFSCLLLRGFGGRLLEGRYQLSHTVKGISALPWAPCHKLCSSFYSLEILPFLCHCCMTR